MQALSGWQRSGVHLLDVAEVRRLVGAFYKSAEGLRSSGETEGLYEATMFPNDRQEWRRLAADTMWSCALRLLAAMRLLGVRHQLLSVPYERRVGRAVTDCSVLAWSFGALVTGARLARYEPQTGDAVCHGWGSNVHVSCVSEAGSDEGGRLVLDCSDGGQGKRDDMAVEANRYLWEAGYVRSVEEPSNSVERPGTKRPVVWCVDLAELLLSAGVLAE